MPVDGRRAEVRQHWTSLKSAYFEWAAYDMDFALQWLQQAIKNHLQQPNSTEAAYFEDLAWAQSKLAQHADRLAEIGEWDPRSGFPAEAFEPEQNRLRREISW